MINRLRQNKKLHYRMLSITKNISVISLSAVATSVLAGASSANAQVARCPIPGYERDDDASSREQVGGGSQSRDPRAREMTRADAAYAAGRREEAAAIYRRLANASPDRRQTARRAKLKLAQVAIAEGDLALAESYIDAATAPGAITAVVTRGRELRAKVADRRNLAADETALDTIDALVANGQFDEALAATEPLLGRSCPNPEDYGARVILRRAQILRAKGDLAGARAVADTAMANASTERIRGRITTFIGEVEYSQRVADLRLTIDRANALLAAGDAAGAINILQPLLALSDLPRELDGPVRTRLARAYADTEQYDAAIAVLQPLLPGANPAGGSALEPGDYDAIARIHLARADWLQKARRAPEATLAYREVLGWSPAVNPEIRDSARLGLARTLAAQGDRAGALEQIELVRSAATSPRLIERADDLFADLEDGTPLNRLFGYVEAGVAYDTNAPTRLSALRDDDGSDIVLPIDRRFDDVSANVAARLQYRHQLGEDGSYLDFSASGLRTMQVDLPQLDRTRIELAVGPSFPLGNGGTEIRFGGQYSIEWRGDRFRASEPGVYVGLRHKLNENVSATATYTVGWHNDYRSERDGTDHSLEGQLRIRPSDADVWTFELRAEREGGQVARVRNWGLLAGAGWRHRWRSEGSIEPFIEVAGEMERILYDDDDVSPGPARRDWRWKLEAGAGVEIDRTWRISANYAYYDLTSNIPARNRIADHQIGITIRYIFR